MTLQIEFLFVNAKTAYDMRISDWSSDVCSSDLPTHAKILLFISIMIGLGAIAWTSDSAWVRWMAYIGLRYMQMGMVTFMHDATHNVLFEPRWENWAFGIIAMTPLPASFVAFK